MDVRFGVHAGLQHTSIAELHDAVAPHRGARLRLDLDLGPLLRGRRHRRPALPRSDHRAHRARGDDRPRARAARSSTPPATATRRCSPTRWRRSTRSRDGRVVLGLGGGWLAERVRRVRHALRHARRAAAHARASTSSACAACSRRTRTTFDGRVLHARATRSASRSRCRRGCRSGSAAAARR